MFWIFNLLLILSFCSVIDPFHVPQQPHQVPVIRARFSALRIFDTKRDFLTDDEVVTPPSSVLTPTTTQPPEILTTVVVPAPVVLAEEVEAPLTLPVTAKDLLESVIGMPSEDHVFAAEKGSGIINEGNSRGIRSFFNINNKYTYKDCISQNPTKYCS